MTLPDQLARVRPVHVLGAVALLTLGTVGLTLWLLGWVGMLPVAIFGVVLAFPLCLVGIAAPDLYIAWRTRAHRASRLRCDWIVA